MRFPVAGRMRRRIAISDDSIPMLGTGGSFYEWLLTEDPRPYNSWGNGSAMRVAPVGFAFATVRDVLHEAERSAVVTHDHREGIKGAQATALAVFMARTGASKADIRKELIQRFGYNLHRTVEEIRPAYTWDVSCQRSVPEAIVAFLDSSNVEDAIRLAVSLGVTPIRRPRLLVASPRRFTSMCPR